MASALYGTVLGSLLGGWPTDRLGRKATLPRVGVPLEQIRKRLGIQQPVNETSLITN